MLGPIISRVLMNKGLNKVLARQKLLEAWRTAVGPKLAPNTRLTGIRGNVLRVEVKSAAHLQELSTFHKVSILQKIRTSGTSFFIQDIEFRIGSF